MVPWNIWSSFLFTSFLLCIFVCHCYRRTHLDVILVVTRILEGGNPHQKKQYPSLLFVKGVFFKLFSIVHSTTIWGICLKKSNHPTSQSKIFFLSKRSSKHLWAVTFCRQSKPSLVGWVAFLGKEFLKMTCLFGIWGMFQGLWVMLQNWVVELQIFFYFHPELWGRFPFWLIFFNWVGSTTK